MTLLDTAGRGRPCDPMLLLRNSDDLDRLTERFHPLDAPLADGLTAAEALALRAFTTPGHPAAQINQALASETASAAILAFASLLDTALRKLRSFDGVVYRRVPKRHAAQFGGTLCIGRSIRLRGFTSGSWTEVVPQDGDVVFALRTRRAAILAPWSDRLHVGDVLLPRGSILAVRALTTVGAGLRIDLEDLADTDEPPRSAEPVFIPTLVSWQSVPSREDQHDSDTGHHLLSRAADALVGDCDLDRGAGRAGDPACVEHEGG